MQQGHAHGELAKAMSVDQHGIEPIATEDRDSTPWHQFWIWFGANITPTSWVVGAIGPQLGLSLVQSIAVMFVGQLAGCLLFGLFAVMGHRTGVSQLALGRRAFGLRGNAIPSVIQGLITLSWVGLNTYVVLSAATFCLHKLGLPDSRGVQYAVAAAIMLLQVAIGTLGFYAIRTFEKWTVPVLAVVMAVMTVLAFAKGHVVWSHATVHGADALTAMTQLMTAVGIGWGFSWVAWASDYSRFTATTVGERPLYWFSAVGTFLPVIWLGTLGAAMASGATNSDPAELVASLFGIMTIPVLLVIVHGAVAVNVESVYSAPLCFLAAGVRVKRWLGSLVTAVIATGVLIGFMASSAFATSFTNYMNSFVIWTAAWGAIVLVEFYVVRREPTDLRDLFGDPARSRYGDVKWSALAALAAGLVAGWAWEYGSASAFQGPLARATDGVDLSWLAAIVVAGGLYLAMARRHRRAPAEGLAAEPANEPVAEVAGL
jgi:NCS1 family nucleobase:cation symporter-1